MAKGMNVEVTRAEVVAAVAEAAAVTERKSTMPILGCVRLTARNGHLEILGSDLDLTVARIISGGVEQGGAACVPGRALHDILRSLGGDKVRLELNGNQRLTVRSAGTEFRVVGLDPEDYPTVKVEEAAATFRTVQAQVLGRLLARASPAASTDPARVNLNCVLLEREESDVVAVATDGHRMVVAREPGTFVGRNWMLPAKAVAALRRFLDAVDGEVSIAETGNSVIVKAGGAVLVARQGEGGFPDWRQVLPKGRKGGLTVKSESLSEVAKRVGLVAHKQTLTLQLAEAALRVEANDPERGEAREALAVSYAGAEAKLGINGRFLADAIEGAGADEVCVTFGEQIGQEAVEVRPVGAGGFLAVIMPVRV